MSLDNTSHPGRPVPDELVPSRHALRVGEVDVLVVSHGVFAMPAATMSTNADPAARAAWLNEMFLPDTLDWALNVVVVRSRGRTILIDAGLGVEYPDFPRAGQLAPRLEAAGIDLHAHGPRRRAARRRGEGAAVSGPAGPRGGRHHAAW